MNTLSDLLAQAQPREEEKRFVDKSMQLSGLIYEAMQRQGLTQRALAEQLGKKESEVSKWLNGLHNFTLKTLTKLETVLGEDLVLQFRDSLPTATALPRTNRTARLADEWTEAPFRDVAVNKNKRAASPAIESVLFSLRAA